MRKILSAAMVAAMSGNQTLEGIGEISKNYDGVRLGFDLKR